MEVCADSVLSAVNAEKGGAIRVELCSNLAEGGTTPSAGLLKVVKSRLKIPIYVMLRPRGGDFFYSDDEFEVLMEDLKLLKTIGADGFVFGFLNSNGTIDKDRCKEVIDAIRPLAATFHRAIDTTVDIMTALEVVIKIGFTRVLTSGGCSTALEGLPIISEMICKAKGRIIVMPGGGINENNISRVLQQSKAKEFHCSARTSRPSLMQFQKAGIPMGTAFHPPEYSTKVTDVAKVQHFISLSELR
ncbi:copper homeostasis protein cutC homolog isoform X1 [Mytilus galloprovincialis]|uniref:copper homeostasis protein cutC homolog isoform X1 n=1 Tax=Mytilus galloprovincialis TaxID=29158 RepID=UPI003F7C0A6E